MANSGTPSNPYINAMCDDNGFTQYGMTLRDYFAAKAMQSFTNIWYIDAKNNPESIAKKAYILADAMLKQRENEAI